MKRRNGLFHWKDNLPADSLDLTLAVRAVLSQSLRRTENSQGWIRLPILCSGKGLGESSQRTVCNETGRNGGLGIPCGENIANNSKEPENIQCDNKNMNVNKIQKIQEEDEGKKSKKNNNEKHHFLGTMCQILCLEIYIHHHIYFSQWLFCKGYYYPTFQMPNWGW